MDASSRRARFEREVLPHLDAAYNLARWLLRSDHDAEDVTQDSMLRAYRFFDSFRGANAKAWLLAIVRNGSYIWLACKRLSASVGRRRCLTTPGRRRPCRRCGNRGDARESALDQGRTRGTARKPR
jgi:hypothetical protein